MKKPEYILTIPMAILAIYFTDGTRAIGASPSAFSQYGQIQSVQKYSSNPFWSKDSPYNMNMPKPIYATGADLNTGDCNRVVENVVANFCANNNGCVNMRLADARPKIMVQLAELPGHNFATSCGGYIDTVFKNYSNGVGTKTKTTNVNKPTTSKNTKNNFTFENPLKQKPTQYERDVAERAAELEGLQSITGTTAGVNAAAFPKTVADLSFSERIKNAAKGYEPYKDAKAYRTINIESEESFMARKAEREKQRKDQYCIEHPDDEICEDPNQPKVCPGKMPERRKPHPDCTCIQPEGVAQTEIIEKDGICVCKNGGDYDNACSTRCRAPHKERKDSANNCVCKAPDRMDAANDCACKDLTKMNDDETCSCKLANANPETCECEGNYVFDPASRQCIPRGGLECWDTRIDKYGLTCTKNLSATDLGYNNFENGQKVFTGTLSRRDDMDAYRAIATAIGKKCLVNRNVKFDDGTKIVLNYINKGKLPAPYTQQDDYSGTTPADASLIPQHRALNATIKANNYTTIPVSVIGPNGVEQRACMDATELFNSISIRTSILFSKNDSLMPGSLYIDYYQRQFNKDYVTSDDCSDTSIGGNADGTTTVNLAAKAVSMVDFCEDARTYFVDYPQSSEQRVFPGLLLEICANDTNMWAQEHLIVINNYVEALKLRDEYAYALGEAAYGNKCNNQGLYLYLVKTPLEGDDYRGVGQFITIFGGEDDKAAVLVLTDPTPI